jgi:hypothetical protein
MTAARHADVLVLSVAALRQSSLMNRYAGSANRCYFFLLHESALMYGPAARRKRDGQNRICGLALMYSASNWSGSVLRAIMDTRAQPI